MKEVYFDDFKVEHVKSPVIQSQSYYPFGLTFNEYERENSTKNKYLFNQGTGDNTFNTERVAELDLNVDQSLYRTYDFVTGRWWQVDPKGDAGGQESWSTYQFGFDNPIRYSDAKGDCPPIICGAIAGAIIGAAVGATVAYLDGKSGDDILAAAGSGAVSGAIIGSGVGFLAAGAAGTGGAVAVGLANATGGAVVTNAAVGFVAGASEEIVKQGIEGQQGRRTEVETGKIVKSALVSAVANGVAGPIAGTVVKNTIGKVVGQTTAEVATEGVVNKASDVAKDALSPPAKVKQDDKAKEEEKSKKDAPK